MVAGNGDGRWRGCVLSLLLHGVLLVGVGFALEDAAPVMPTLDVILTQTQCAICAVTGLKRASRRAS